MPTHLGMAAAVVLAALFAWAGAAKLGRPAAIAEGFAQLGLPRPAVVARVVPVVELLLAVSLLAVPAVGGSAALLLLAGFTAVLVRALRRGVPVRCACFGQAGGPPLSWVDLVRNGFLGVLAALAATAAGLEPRIPRVAAVIVVGAGVAGGAAALRTLRRR